MRHSIAMSCMSGDAANNKRRQKPGLVQTEIVRAGQNGQRIVALARKRLADYS
jgi:hypothetical protein